MQEFVDNLRLNMNNLELWWDQMVSVDSAGQCSSAWGMEVI